VALSAVGVLLPFFALLTPQRPHTARILAFEQARERAALSEASHHDTGAGFVPPPLAPRPLHGLGRRRRRTPA